MNRGLPEKSSPGSYPSIGIYTFGRQVEAQNSLAEPKASDSVSLSVSLSQSQSRSKLGIGMNLDTGRDIKTDCDLDPDSDTDSDLQMTRRRSWPFSRRRMGDNLQRFVKTRIEFPTTGVKMAWQAKSRGAAPARLYHKKILWPSNFGPIGCGAAGYVYCFLRGDIQ